MSGGKESVRRRAGADAGNKQFRIAPNFGAFRIDTDRQVTVKAETHAAFYRGLVRQIKLPFRFELHKLKELYAFLVRSYVLLNRFGVEILKLFFPCPPAAAPSRRAFFVIQALENGHLVQVDALAFAETLIIRLALLVLAELEPFVKFAQQFYLKAINLGILNQFAAAEFLNQLQIILPVGRHKFRHIFNVDIYRVHKQAAQRTVRAGVFRIGMIQHVERIETDDIGAAAGGDFDQFGQIRKIADTPIAFAFQRIELYIETPNLAAGQSGIFKTAAGRHGQSRKEKVFIHLKGQAVIAETQRRIDAQLYPGQFRTVQNIALAGITDAKRQLTENAGAGILRRGDNVKGGTETRNGNNRAETDITFFHDINRIQRSHPATAFYFGQRRIDIVCRPGFKSQTVGNKADNVFADFIIFFNQSGVGKAHRKS